MSEEITPQTAEELETWPPGWDTKKITRKNKIAMSTAERLRAMRMLAWGLHHRGMSRSDLAKALGLTLTAVGYWVQFGTVPASRVMEVSNLLRYEGATADILRPDIFRPPVAQDLIPKIYQPLNF